MNRTNFFKLIVVAKIKKKKKNELKKNYNKNECTKNVFISRITKSKKNGKKIKNIFNRIIE